MELESISNQIFRKHLVDGIIEEGTEIGISIDQTLTQDATGTLTYMFLEAIGVKAVKSRLSVSYIDHNVLQTDSISGDDHIYLQTVASKFGVILSKAGNGICHSLHVDRFARPGCTLIGSDSHTPTSGALGMVAFGAGGLDVAAAMSGEPYYFTMPSIVGVKLTGRLPPWVSAKDIILSLLQLTGVKGGKGRIFEYFGDGVSNLTVPERATIANMGTETGATTSIFPSDEKTLSFLKRHGRQDEWIALPSPSAEVYQDLIEINLSTLEPLIATPHSPGNIVEVRTLNGLQINQVCIGSCTNSSYQDLMRVAKILKGNHVHPNVSLTISPGSNQVLRALLDNGALHDLLSAGARILECACGPCIGMGQAPPSQGVSLRTFNRNFQGRSGTQDAKIYLVSPEVAAISAIFGVITDPRKYPTPKRIILPKHFLADSALIINPAQDSSSPNVIKRAHMQLPPLNNPLDTFLQGYVLSKLSDNISTDHILPAGAKILPLRSNIPKISMYTLSSVDPHFIKRAQTKGEGFIVGGDNYGQGSSREHAALCVKYLGVKAVLAKSFARIHQDNLINFGVVPLQFVDDSDYAKIRIGDLLNIGDMRSKMLNGQTEFLVENVTRNFIFRTVCKLSKRKRNILLKGGLLAYIKQKMAEKNE